MALRKLRRLGHNGQMGEWLASAWAWLAPAWPWLAPLLAAPVVVPLLHQVWIRPIIRVQLEGEAEPANLVSKQDQKVVAQAVYLRLRIQNRGRTTVKDCLGNLVRMTVWDGGGKVFNFAREVHPLGWAHYPSSKQRN